MNPRHQLGNARQLARALGCSEWVIYGVKKANRIRAGQTGEPLIFTGRFSTVAKVQRWLDDHPDFVANQVLAPQRQAAARVRRPLRPRPAA